MNLNLEVEQEEDGRWLAEVLELPGAMAYGASADEAMVKAEALAFRALAEQLEHGEVSPLPITLSVPRPHEWLACSQGQTGSCCSVSPGLVAETAERVPSHPLSRRMA